MDLNVILIGLGIVVAIIIIGKILKIVTKILLAIIVIILISVGVFAVLQKTPANSSLLKFSNHVALTCALQNKIQ